MDIELLCSSCQVSLREDGLLLASYLGPLVLCLGCRALYYLHTKIEKAGVAVLLIPAMIDDVDAYDIIRQSNHENFAEYLSKQILRHHELYPRTEKGSEDLSPIKEVIKSCTTPTDLIRKLDSI